MKLTLFRMAMVLGISVTAIWTIGCATNRGCKGGSCGCSNGSCGVSSTSNSVSSTPTYGGSGTVEPNYGGFGGSGTR